MLNTKQHSIEFIESNQKTIICEPSGYTLEQYRNIFNKPSFIKIIE